MNLMVPVSVGELIDKLTILDIKAERIKDPDKLANIHRERAALEAALAGSDYADPDISEERRALKAINETLWEIEDDIRAKERDQAFDEAFIALARRVYRTNDARAELKRQLNQKLGSALVEEKSYEGYGAD